MMLMIFSVLRRESLTGYPAGRLAPRLFRGNTGTPARNREIRSHRLDIHLCANILALAILG